MEPKSDFTVYCSEVTSSRGKRKTASPQQCAMELWRPLLSTQHQCNKFRKPLIKIIILFIIMTSCTVSLTLTLCGSVMMGGGGCHSLSAVTWLKPKVWTFRFLFEERGNSTVPLKVVLWWATAALSCRQVISVSWCPAGTSLPSNWTQTRMKHRKLHMYAFTVNSCITCYSLISTNKFEIWHIHHMHD